MTPQKRLTDPTLKSLLQKARAEEEAVPDGSVPGLTVRLFPGGGANWALIVRVKGEGGVNRHGKPLLGKRLRVSLGNYPQVSLQAARAQANHLLEEAKRGINPKTALAQSATVYTMTVRQLSEKYLKDYVLSKGLDSAKNYTIAFATHINSNHRRPARGAHHARGCPKRDERCAREAAAPERPEGRPTRWH
jgi:Arm DNA-binding domain